MRSRGAALATLAAAALLPSPAAWSQATDWKQIPKPPLRAFVPRQPQRSKTSRPLGRCLGRETPTQIGSIENSENRKFPVSRPA